MDAAETYQGERIGLPRDGVGSVGAFGRRLVALAVDWALCQIIAIGLLGMQWGQVAGAEAFLPLGLFFLLNVVTVPTIGTTIGHRLVGVRVVSLDGDGRQPPPPARALVRAALLCLFVPAVIMDADGRGLHDKAARTVVVKDR